MKKKPQGSFVGNPGDCSPLPEKQEGKSDIKSRLEQSPDDPDDPAFPEQKRPGEILE